MLFPVPELLAVHVHQRSLDVLRKRQQVLGDSGQLASISFFAAKHPYPYIQSTISLAVPEVDPRQWFIPVPRE